MARNVTQESTGDLIVAPATASGTGAIAIVRLSGPGAHKVAQALQPHIPKPPDFAHMYLGYIRSANGSQIDQGLVCLWLGPKSYTGEDMAEFHLHGSPAIVDAVVAACVEAGARYAQPGEFTRRAYLNGKLDLTQAEAVSDLTRSQTDDARRAALYQLGGGLSQILLSIRKELVQVTAELEANVDYPEEDIPAADKQRLGTMVDKSLKEIDRLADSFRRGRRLSVGARVVFAGPPNAGKSSLFNAILRRERAIVTPHAGTTRDMIEAVIDLQGIPVTLIDTAGLRANAEEIEAMGIQRTRDELQSADLVLFIVDASQPDDAIDEYRSIQHLEHLLVFNKFDLIENSIDIAALKEHFSPTASTFWISVTGKSGISQLEAEIAERFCLRKSEGGGAVITSSRHETALRRAGKALQTVTEGIATTLSPEFIVVDLQTALSEIDTILGKTDLDEDILDAVFSTFCLGK